MKKMAVFFFLVLGYMLFTSCKSNFVQTKATIIQRKLLNDSVLRVNYKYTALGNFYEDSLEIKNKIVVSDTVQLIFSEKNPKEHQLKMP